MSHHALVMNTKKYSIEAFFPKKFISEEKITNEKLIKFADIALQKNLQNVDYEDLKERMIGFDNDYYSTDKEKTNKIYYIVMEGKCQDEQKLTYFIPSRIIKRGKLTTQEFKKIIKKI
jgi:hypothetical protein